VYRKNIEWLNGVNENKQKLTEKIRKEMKITDETERIIRSLEESELPVNNDINSDFLIELTTHLENISPEKPKKQIKHNKENKNNNTKIGSQNYFKKQKEKKDISFNNSKANEFEVVDSKIKDRFTNIEDLISSIRKDVNKIEEDNQEIVEKISKIQDNEERPREISTVLGGDLSLEMIKLSPRTGAAQNITRGFSFSKQNSFKESNLSLQRKNSKNYNQVRNLI
jgi:hypothetical protein